MSPAHDHSHDNPRGHHHGAAAQHRGRLQIAFVVIALFFVAQVVVAVTTGSLALLSYAGHMLTDSVGLGLALTAIVVASLDGRERGITSGLYRLEVLAALANACLL